MSCLHNVPFHLGNLDSKNSSLDRNGWCCLSAYTIQGFSTPRTPAYGHAQPTLRGYCSEPEEEPQASVFQAIPALAAAHRQPRGGSHSFWGMTRALSPSPQVGDKPRHACDPSGSRPVPLFPSFSCVHGSGFSGFHQRLKLPPPITSQGAGRASPGVWATTVNKAARGPLSPALPRQACLLGGQSQRPGSALLLEPHCLTGFSPEPAPSLHFPCCGSCNFCLGTWGGWAGAGVEQAGSWSILSGM